jgi:amino acid permease
MCSQLAQGPASVLIDFSLMGVMIFNVGKSACSRFG